MHDTMYDDVKQFHEKFGHTVGITPAVRDEKLRINLIAEEAKEVCRALAQEDLEEVIDGCMDLMYVTLGTLVAAGFTSVEVHAFWKAVHNANMAKLGPDGKPIYRELDKKVMRPDGWQPPDIGGILRTIQSRHHFENHHETNDPSGGML